MNTTNLITNALLATTWEHSKKDYLDIISPFVIYSAFHETTNDERIIDVPELTRYVNKEFSLNLVDSITICILNRNKAHIEKVKKPDRYILIEGSYDIQTFENQRFTSRKNYEYFIEQMQKFLLEKTGKTFEIKKLEEKLKRYISTNFFDLLNMDNKIISYRDNELALFLSYILEKDTMLKEILTDIVKGQMIYEALYSQHVDSADIKQKFNNLYIYFDTTFIFYMLGYGGDRYKDYISQIISLLKGLGAKLRCFRHTYDEVYGILRSCEISLGNGNGKRLFNLDWFIEKQMTSSDVAIILSNLEANISKYLEITDTPDYSQQIKNINWAAFTKYLEEHIDYRKEKARVNDVESIAAIFRLRDTNNAKTLEACNAIFVTTNRKLVKIIRDYQRESDDMKGYYPCISEYEISNIAWLKTPHKQNDFLERSLRFSVSILKEPSPIFWKRFTETVDKFHDEGSITLGNASELKYELYSKKNTMEVIQEDDAEITLESLNEILKRNKETQFKDLTDEVKRKTDKIEQLKNADQNIANDKLKKSKKVWTIFFVAFYVLSFIGALVLAGFSIADLCIDMTSSPFKFVFVVEIAGVLITLFIPKVKELWNIKKTISKAVAKKVEKKRNKLEEEIEKKYSE